MLLYTNNPPSLLLSKLTNSRSPAIQADVFPRFAQRWQRLDLEPFGRKPCTLQMRCRTFYKHDVMTLPSTIFLLNATPEGCGVCFVTLILTLKVMAL